MLKVVSLGLNIDKKISGAEITSIAFNNEFTLLDADVVLINPESARLLSDASETDQSNFTLQKDRGQTNDFALWWLNERKKQLTILSQKRKVVVTFCTRIKTFILSKYIEGSETYHNYGFIPFDTRVFFQTLQQGKGSTIKITNQNHFFSSFFSAFQNKLDYYLYFYPAIRASFNVFLENTVNQAVGFSALYNEALFVFLPIPNEFNSEKFLGTIIECSKNFIFDSLPQNKPDWLAEFELPGEQTLQKEIEKYEMEINGLKAQQQKVESMLDKKSDFKRLLYDRGKSLENIVEKSFQLMGFKTSKRIEADMEHDLIIEADEGEAIIEIEGKENNAINIDKLDQLSRVVDEDFNITGKYRDGILIGNHYAKTSPTQRKAPFTDKVNIAARRKSFILLSSFELFKIVDYILKDDSEDIKRSIRTSILNSKGTEYKFSVQL